MKIVAFANGLKLLIPVMLQSKAMILAFSTATKIATITQAGFNAVMNANPVVLLCSSIALAVVTLSALELKFKLVTRAVEKFKRVAKGIGEQFADQNRRNREAREKTSLHQYATGTSFASGGVSLVGETGAELVNLPRGSKVLNSKDTAKTLGKDVTVNLNIAGNVIGNQEFITQIKHVLGRELQVALNC